MVIKILKEMKKIKKLVKAINYIEQLNIDEINELDIGIELQDFTEPNLNDAEIERIVKSYKEILKDFKGIKSLHGPFLDLKPASPDLSIRKFSYSRYLNAIEVGKELGIDYIIFHSQINPFLNEPKMRRLNNMQSKEFWKEILGETEYDGIILIENIFEETPTMLKEYIEAINMPNIRINLDIGHAKLGKVSLEEWIVQLKDYIEYMHIHSNNGLYDQHNVPEDEEIEELLYLLDKYKLNPIISLEYNTKDLASQVHRYKR